jgi:hypothetical protein
MPGRITGGFSQVLQRYRLLYRPFDVLLHPPDGSDFFPIFRSTTSYKKNIPCL